MTNHAHSYGVEVSGNEIQTTHICLNDGAVEGFRVKNRPIFGFQFHPNLGFGPTDARRVFDPFISLVKDA